MIYKFLVCIFCWVIGFYISISRVIAIDRYNLNFEFSLKFVFKDFIFVLSNNLGVAILLLVLGYFSFGFFTLLLSVYNGYLLGIISHFYLLENEVSTLLLNLKHAPSEIIALCIFGAIGLNGYSYNLKLKTLDEFLHLIRSYKNHIFFALTLLILSAYIETSVNLNSIK